MTGANQEMRFYLELEWIVVAHTPQVQHLVAQFDLKEVIESAVDRCKPGDEVLFGVGYGRIIRAPSIQGTCEGQIKPRSYATPGTNRRGRE